MERQRQRQERYSQDPEHLDFRKLEEARIDSALRAFRRSVVS